MRNGLKQRERERGMGEEDGDLLKKEMTLADSDGKLVIERNSRLDS